MLRTMTSNFFQIFSELQHMRPRNATDQLIQTNVPLQLQFVIFKAQLRWRFSGPLDASFTQYCPILLSDHFSTVDSGHE